MKTSIVLPRVSGGFFIFQNRGTEDSATSISVITPHSKEMRDGAEITGDELMFAVEEAIPVQPEKSALKLHIGPDDVDWPVGLTAIIAPTGVGKTRTIWEHLIKDNNFVTPVVMLESFSNEEQRTYDNVAFSYYGAMVRSGQLMMQGIVPVIDSFRVLVYEAGGNAGSKGIAMGLFGYLTALDMILARQGLRMLAALNPLVPSEQMDDFVDYVKSSTAASMLVERTGVVQYSARPIRASKRYAFSAGSPANRTSGQGEQRVLHERLSTVAPSWRDGLPFISFGEDA